MEEGSGRGWGRGDVCVAAVRLWGEVKTLETGRRIRKARFFLGGGESDVLKRQVLDMWWLDLRFR